ncbi:MAG: DUF4349 domain-containing protein [Anaerolineae bacterium]|nr:DUF4349 domain-containing protein [Anaerolineae bacterium]
MKLYTGVLCAFVLLAVLAAGCGATPASIRVATQAPRAATEEAAKIVEKTVEVEKIEALTVAATPAPLPATPGSLNDTTSGVLPAAAPRPNRFIIKNSEMQMTVEDSDAALDRVTQVVGDLGGYIISSRIWFQDWLGESYKYASVTMGIPVDRFETAMRRLRGLALQVDDEHASGQDVTDEYVDLESRLGNLEATRDRIRTFLDKATTVEESLRVNEQLAAVEAEIEAVKGRMNYLYDRSSYSTITVQLNPALPPAPVPPTPTPTPTATPTPTPEPWNASAIASDATSALTSVLQTLAGIAIWFGIVVLPLVFPVVLIAWGVQRVARRLGFK